MSGKHRAKKRHAEAYVWLGTGAMTLGLGVALSAGSGVAQADSTNASVVGSGGSRSQESSAATTSIRTTISALSVNTSTHSPTPVVAREENPRSVVTTTSESLVRRMNPADTGDNGAGGDAATKPDLLGLGNSGSGILGGGAGSGILGGGAGPSIPTIIELAAGGGGGGLVSRIAGALGF